MTAVLDIILIAVLVTDIVVHALRWRAERAAARAAAAAHDVDPGAEPPTYDEPGGEPWQVRR